MDQPGSVAGPVAAALAGSLWPAGAARHEIDVRPVKGWQQVRLDPLMAAGNWAPELVAYAGGESVFGEIGQHSPWLSWEELQVADPDVLVLSPCGFTLERTMEDLSLLQQHPAWESLQAVKNGRVYAIDGNAYLNRSGPRLVESAELLARVIWGKRLGVEVDDAWRHIG